MATIGSLNIWLRLKSALFDRGLRKSGRRVGQFSRTVQMASRSMRSMRRLLYGGMGLYALYRGLKVVLGEFGKFEHQLAEVSTMLSGPAMSHMMEYKRGIEDLSVAMGESTETLAKGLYDILSASIAPGQAMEVLAVSAKAAKAGLTDTGTAADALTSVLNSYAMMADEATRVSDKLFMTVKRGKLRFPDIAENIGKVSAAAALAGMSLNELLAAIATMTRAGVKTEQAITSIRMSLKSFLKPTDDAVAAAKQFGIELNMATLRSKGLLGILRQLRLRGGGAADLARMFPARRGLAGLAALMKNMEGFAGDIDLMAQSAGAAEAAFQKMASTSVHTWAQAKQAFIAAARSIGEDLAPSINELAKSLRDSLPVLVKFVQLAFQSDAGPGGGGGGFGRLVNRVFGRLRQQPGLLGKIPGSILSGTLPTQVSQGWQAAKAALAREREGVALRSILAASKQLASVSKEVSKDRLDALTALAAAQKAYHGKVHKDLLDEIHLNKIALSIEEQIAAQKQQQLRVEMMQAQKAAEVAKKEREERERNLKSVRTYMQRIWHERQMVGMGADQKRLYRLSVMPGVSHEDLKRAQADLEYIKRLTKQQDAVDELKRKNESLRQAGVALWEGMMTPLERYEREVERLGELLAGAFIGKQTYARALARARAELQGAEARAPMQLPAPQEARFMRGHAASAMNRDRIEAARRDVQRNRHLKNIERNLIPAAVADKD